MSRRFTKQAGVLPYLPDWVPDWVQTGLAIATPVDAIMSHIKLKKMQKEMAQHQKQIAESAAFNKRIKDIGMALLGGAAIAEGGRMINRFVHDKPVIKVPDVSKIFVDPETTKSRGIKKTAESFLKALRELNQ